MMESNQLHVFDFSTIQEISTFVEKGASYEAEEGRHDDLVMCLVLFAWLSNQEFFKDITDNNTMRMMKERSDEDMFNELPPFGIIDNGIDEEIHVDDDGTVWTSQEMYDMDDGVLWDSMNGRMKF